MVVRLALVGAGVVTQARTGFARLARAQTTIDEAAAAVRNSSAGVRRTGVARRAATALEADLRVSAACATASARRRTRVGWAIWRVRGTALALLTGGNLADWRRGTRCRSRAADADAILAEAGRCAIVAWLTIGAVDRNAPAVLAGLHFARGIGWQGRTGSGVTTAALLAVAVAAGLALWANARLAVRAAGGDWYACGATELEA